MMLFTLLHSILPLKAALYHREASFYHSKLLLNHRDAKFYQQSFSSTTIMYYFPWGCWILPLWCCNCITPMLDLYHYDAVFTTQMVHFCYNCSNLMLHLIIQSWNCTFLSPDGTIEPLCPLHFFVFTFFKLLWNFVFPFKLVTFII
jgi:hypothetical protein